MTNVLRTGVNNFFINEDGSISMQYDPYFNTCFMMYCGEGPKIKISMDKISIQNGGQIVFKFDNQKYIIDDGYRNRLIMAGYLDLPNIEEPEKDRDKQKLRNAIIDLFKSRGIGDMEFTPNSVYVKSLTQGYEISLEIETLNKMIERNIKRTELSLPMYPTERGYSKVTSLYFRLYAKRCDAKSSKNYEELHNICNKMLRSIVCSNKFNWNEIFQLTGQINLKFQPKELHIRRTILKWEEEL